MENPLESQPSPNSGSHPSAHDQGPGRCYINNLPYDVFHKIFTICHGQPTITDNSFPILASHVCRIWRHHALDTGTLWTKHEFRTRSPNFEKHSTFMDRANGAPLDVIIDETPFRSSSVKHAKEIMRLLVQHVSHLRTLEVWRAPLKILRIIFDRFAELPAPQLRKLTVRSDKSTAWYAGGRPTKWKFQPFVRTEAPNLRELNLYGINPTNIIERFKGLQILRLKWTGVFKGVSPYDHAKAVQELLLLLPDLRYLLLGHRYSDHVGRDVNSLQLLPDLLPPPITHTSLMHASIGAKPICSNGIMASLALPKLRYAIDRDQNELSLAVACLPVIAEPTECPFPALITLRLRGGYDESESIAHPWNAVNMSHLDSVLSRLKQLRSLTFDHIDFEGDQYFPCVGWTCPKLDWLSFIACLGFSMRQVRSVVETRLQQQEAKKKLRPLVRLVVYQRSSVPPMVFEDGDREWLEGALKLDMKIHQRDPMGGQDYLLTTVYLTRTLAREDDR
ncbi:hypothetical protein FRB90_000930 [Tulasnella sp. 427]|nr:hypothetical protein FRB90_000930 [Tulasnella sp. 427]